MIRAQARKLLDRKPATAFAVAALLESLFVPFLIDALLLGLVLRGANLWRMVAYAVPASILGTVLWYALGVALGPEALVFVAHTFDVSPAVQATAAARWEDNWALALFTASVTAIPDPLVAAIAGSSGTPALATLAILTISHALRFIVMGLVIALAARLARRGNRSLQAWVARLSIGASVVVGGVLGAVLVWRMVV